LDLPPNHTEARRRRRAPPRRTPLWRRIAYARVGAILFCLFVWLWAARACMALA